MCRVLVIEDEKNLRDNILEILTIEGFEGFGAENGSIGVQLIQDVTPDLILCDIMMPELDGYGVLATVRANPETALLPFIFLTAKGMLDDVREGMNLGADDYLVKPLERADLLKAIATRLTKQSAIFKLQQQISDLEQSILLKDEFLNSASEQLKGPLTTISMAVQMLQKAPTKEKLQYYTTLLQGECNREIKLINQLLELQRLATNSRPGRPELIDIQRRLPIMIAPYRQRAQANDQLLQIILPPYLSSLTIDPYDLEQILGELLDNACKYTPLKGKIVLEVSRSPRPSLSNGQMGMATTVTVSNEAEIPANEIPNLFDRFYRGSVSPALARSSGPHPSGSGLGLTLVKNLVDRLDGTVQVISESGWTYCIVQLPI